jgi:hypothetical protein
MNRVEGGKLSILSAYIAFAIFGVIIQLSSCELTPAAKT